MSYPLSDFFEYVNYFVEHQKPKDMLYLQYDNHEYDILDPVVLIPNSCPTNKELRLALDLVDFMYPLFKSSPIEDKAEALKSVLKISTSKKKLKQLRNHKRIVFRRLITIKNNKVKLTRVIKN